MNKVSIHKKLAWSAGVCVASFAVALSTLAIDKERLAPVKFSVMGVGLVSGAISLAITSRYANQFHQVEQLRRTWNLIEISRINKAVLLEALYNAAHPREKEINLAKAWQIISRRGLKFNTVLGKELRCDLSRDQLDPYLYDRANGENAAARAVQKLRNCR